MPTRILSTILTSCLAVAGVAAHPGSAIAASAQEINREATTALQTLFEREPATKDLAAKAKAILQSRLYEVVQEGLAAGDALTDEDARDLVERYLAAEEDRAKVRRSYVEPLSKVVSGRKLARFIQIENKIDAVARFEMASEIPLFVSK